MYFVIGGATVTVAIWLSEKLGGHLGGIIATAPTVVLVAYLIVALRGGALISADFAWGSLRGLGATAIFMITLAVLSKYDLRLRLLAATLIWLLVAWILTSLGGRPDN